MKKLAFTALCIGSLGLFACGGGDDDADVDSGVAVCGDNVCSGGETVDTCPEDCDSNPIFDTPPAACNAVAGTGCDPDEKCTFIVESTEPFLGRTDCAPAGTVPEDGTCVRSETTGVDDCAAGLYCIGGVCTEICGALDNTNCDANETCVTFSDLFEDADNTGLCQPGCNPVAAGGTGCPTDEGCYVNLTTGLSSCAPDCGANPACDAGNTGSTAVGGNSCDTQWGTQHCNCEYLNACAPGYGCALNNDPDAATGLVCAYYCDTTETQGAPDCSGSTQLSLSCRQIMTFYNNTQNVPAAIGMCVDGTVFPCAGCYDVAQPGCDTTTCPP